MSHPWMLCLYLRQRVWWRHTESLTFAATLAFDMTHLTRLCWANKDAEGHLITPVRQRCWLMVKVFRTCQVARKAYCWHCWQRNKPKKKEKEKSYIAKHSGRWINACGGRKRETHTPVNFIDLQYLINIFFSQKSDPFITQMRYWWM